MSEISSKQYRFSLQKSGEEMKDCNSILSLVIALLLAIPCITHPEVLNVPDDFESIQAGINAAEDGDTVLVQPGVYVENIRIIRRAITVASLILTTSNPAYTDSTIIDGDRRASVVTISDQADENTILRGFTLRNGLQERGGGINCLESSPTLKNLVIVDNISNSHGGGIHCCGESSPTMEDLVIVDNVATSNGGSGIVFCPRGGNQPSTLTRVTICNNTNGRGGGYGGGIWDQAGVLEIINCTIYNNSAAEGGGIHFESREGSSVLNSIIWANEPDQVTRDLGDCITWSNIEDGHEGEGNINEDPLFVDTDSGDYHLQWGSPCIDTGDPDTNPDPDGSRADMGAYPFSHGGVVEGYVLDALNDEPLENAIVGTSFGIVDTTDEDGYFKLACTPHEEFDITASRLDYIDSTLVDQSIEHNDTLDIIIELLHPILTPSIERITAELTQEERADIDFSIVNEGNGPLEWSVKLRLDGESGVDPWELRQSYNVGQIVDDSWLQGVVFIDGLFYVSGGGNDTNSIYILNRESELVNTFPQFGDSRLGMKGLAFDGELIWGVAEETVFGFNTAGDSITSFEGPFNRTAAIAWDPDRDLLWISGVTTDIHGYDRLGGHDQEDEISRHGLSIYGLAYWPEDPDGYQLYVFHHTEVNSQVVHKINIETGDTLFVRELSPEGGGHAEGAFITNEYDAYGNWVFMDIASSGDGDRIDIWQLEEPNDDWMSIEPIEGTLNPGEEQELVLTLDASGLDSTVEWQGELVFSKAVGGDDTVIPVTLTIAIEDAVDHNLSELPEAFGITSIYPNPFNSMTVVKYTLPMPSEVALNVFDMSGREVLTIYQDQLSIGSHSVTLDGSKLASGLYFVHLAASGQVINRKVVLFK
jgi:hypothetical protein